jgi:hypothetical protein
MTTIERIVEIPADRRLLLDMSLPEHIPCGVVKIVLNFIPAVQPAPAPKLDGELEKALEEAERKWLYNRAHPEELKGAIKKFKDQGPIFDGAAGVIFQRKIRDEWEDRLAGTGLSDSAD